MQDKNPFMEGQILELVHSEYILLKHHGEVLEGCKALVVNGEIEFPAKYKQLKDKLSSINSLDVLDDFIWLRWNKKDDRYNGIEDGAYLWIQFELSSQVDFFDMIDYYGKEVDAEPKNNDGRKVCFWCRGETKEIDMAVTKANICTKCGR